MAFRATSSIAAGEYQRAKQLAVQVQSLATTRSAAFTASGATYSEIQTVIDNLANYSAWFDEIKTTAGILQYAKDQEDDQTYDVAAEFNALIAAIDATILQLSTDLPKDGNDWLLVNKINANGTLVPRNFTAGALATTIANLDAIAAAVS